MKVGYLIIGRLKSTRLPKKVLLPVGGKPFLAHMIDHIKLSRRTNEIILCTSTNSEDDPLEVCAGEQGIACFRGSEDDVIQRLYDASVKFGLDYILTITADCPLVDPVYADKVVEAYEKINADLIMALDLPHGAFTHGIKPSALKKILEIKDSTDTEVWARYFWDTGLFTTYHLPIVDVKFKRPDIRMTLDYPQDYEFFKAVFEGLNYQGAVFSLEAIIDFLNANPSVMDINKDCAKLYLNRYTKQSEIKLKKRFDVKRVVVFGSGSIGQRHMRNLLSMGVTDIAAFRTRKGHYQQLPVELKVKEIDDWQEVIDFKPDIAIISNPSSLHIETAMRIAPLVKGIFIEKPLSHQIDGVNAFIDVTQAKSIVTFVGYNLQFHPLVKAMVQEMERGVLGQPLLAQCQVGQWLESWHPYEDYTKAYYAKNDLGGGVSLTLIHEINLVQKLLGNVKKVVGVFPTHQKLNLDVDTIADMMFVHDNNAVSQIHLDYIQQPKSRSGTLCFENGWMRYDLVNQQLTIQTTQDVTPRVCADVAMGDVDEMYKEELGLFIRYVEEGRMRHDFDLRQAVIDVKIVEALRNSSQTGQVMELMHGK